MPESPVGRQTEFSLAIDRLVAGRPNIILVSGTPRSGQTTFLTAIALAAAELGYTISGPENPSLFIDRSTTIADLRKWFEQLTFARPGQPPSELPSAPGSVQRVIEWVSNKLDDEVEIARHLSRAAPLFLAIDGYNPSTSFGFWFMMRFPRILWSSGERVVIAIAGRPEQLAPLERLSDLVLNLGALDEGQVLAHVSSIGNKLVPPLSDEELNSYVAAVITQPTLLGALETVFTRASTVSLQ